MHEVAVYLINRLMNRYGYDEPLMSFRSCFDFSCVKSYIFRAISIDLKRTVLQRCDIAEI